MPTYSISDRGELELLRKTLVVMSITSTLLFLFMTFFVGESGFMPLGGILFIMLFSIMALSEANESMEPGEGKQRFKTWLTLLIGVLFGGVFVYVEYMLYKLIKMLSDPEIDEWLPPAVVLGVFAVMTAYAYYKLLRLAVPKKA